MEMLEHIAKVGAFFGGLAAIIAAIIGYWSYIRTFQRAAQMLLFIKYTERYEQIMSSYPMGALAIRLDKEGNPPEPSEPLTLAALKYLNLCSEEYYVWKKGYLDDGVWVIWEEELKKTLRSPLYKREWLRLRKEFESYNEFLEYVEGIQGKAISPPSQPAAQVVIAK